MVTTVLLICNKSILPTHLPHAHSGNVSFKMSFVVKR